MAFKMKGSAFYGRGNQSPTKATGDPKGDPKKEEMDDERMENFLSGMNDFGSGSDRDIALRGALDQARKAHQNETEFADDKNRYDSSGNVDPDGEYSVKELRQHYADETDEYEYLNTVVPGGAQNALDNVGKNRANLRKNTTSGNAEGDAEWARQASMGRNATVLQKKSSPAKKSAMKATGDPKKSPELTEAQKKDAMDNAMGSAKVNALGNSTMSRLKKEFGNVNPSLEEAKIALRRATALNGDMKNLRGVLKARFPNDFR